MNREDDAPSAAELREAELLARALEERAPSDSPGVEDALGAARLIKASRGPGLSELRERAIRERIWPTRSRVWPRAAIAAAAVAAVVVLGIWRPMRRADLPRPGLELLRAQLAAAKPGVPDAQARLDAEMAAYRLRLYAALEDAYRSGR